MRMAGRLVGVTMVVLLAGAVASPAFAGAGPGFEPAGSALSGPGHFLHRGARGEADVNVCSDAVSAGMAHCDAHVRTDLFGTGAGPQQPVPAAATAADTANHAVLGDAGAYDPAYLQSAYNAPSATNGGGQTVAIIDAYDAPNAESDLAHYRSEFDLPACTTANGCFEKVDEYGGTNYPAANAGWAQEISLDIDMVSAICPNCHIMLVEATTPSITDLGTAVDEAVSLGANVVSNSYGSPEWQGELDADASYYDHPGVAIVASAGDDGYGVNFPAASPNVIAVGGTSLVQTSDSGVRNAVETVWSGTGSGCSAYEPKPAWQTDTGCSNRTVADVSAVADPSTGVWVYDSADAGWEVFGGTSVAAPIVGALYALADNGASSADLGSYPYANPDALNDVTLGTNGTCGGTYLCTGTAGYDGPTGLGTPIDVAALAAGGVPGLPLSPPPASPTADFSVAASPVNAMQPGVTTGSAVTLTPENGLNGTVTLAASVSPGAGLSAGFKHPSIALGATATKSTLTLTAKTAGTYTVTITATRGALVRKTSLSVSVADFSIHVSPGKGTVKRGKRTHFTVTLTAVGSLKSAINLSVSGLRSRDDIEFAKDPATTSSTQTVAITLSTLDARGRITLHFNGTSGALSHSASVVLTVQ